ncbi:MAG: hypothetical protein PHD81_04885 [Candidatus Nanoarchaeia archaeon]|nr:hypothetical protein [Candidatus Nanoarchaeia archaeon]MDD5588413.1 hypothetical protein [Candidatus Nanoarchaeia archaeon]
MSHGTRLLDLEEKVILLDTCSMFSRSIYAIDFNQKNRIYPYLKVIQGNLTGINSLLEDERVLIPEGVYQEYKNFMKKIKRAAKNFSKYLVYTKGIDKKPYTKGLSILEDTAELGNVIKLPSLTKYSKILRSKKSSFKNIQELEDIKNKFSKALEDSHDLSLKMSKKVFPENEKIKYFLNKINLITKDYKGISTADKYLVATALYFSMFEKRDCAIISRDLDIGIALTSVLHQAKLMESPFNIKDYKENFEKYEIKLYVSAKGRIEGWNDLRLEVSSKDDLMSLEQTLSTLKNKEEEGVLKHKIWLAKIVNPTQ